MSLVAVQEYSPLSDLPSNVTIAGVITLPTSLVTIQEYSPLSDLPSTVTIARVITLPMSLVAIQEYSPVSDMEICEIYNDKWNKDYENSLTFQAKENI